MGIFRFYNQNRLMFFIAIIAIIIIIFIIQILNSLVIEENAKPKNVIVDEKLYESKIDIEEQISDTQVEENKELVIDQFIRYCNSKNTQSAYNLLTDECKEIVFPTIEIFESNYINTIFKTQKLYSVKQYIGNTYKVDFYENMLVTGNSNISLNQDYYTIVNQDGKIKLNISNFVKREISNRKTKNNYMEVEVVKKDIYMEYEVYELKITNLTPNIIILDTKEKTKTMYLLDENNIEYYSASHEVIDNTLQIKPKATNIVQIKFMKEHRSNSSQKIVFEDIILNYIENTKTNEYEKMKIEVRV